MKFNHRWSITTDGSDSSGRATLPYICRLLQETATLHAEKLGWGYDVLEENGLQWVLSRQWVKLKRYPRWKEEVTVSTWPSAKGAITWNRDFRILDEENREIGIATSLWFVMDRATRRPRPAKVGPDMPTENAERVRENDLKPLPGPEDAVSAGKIVTAYHDIDVHDHVNNVRYLTWMLDGLNPGFIRNHQLKELEINFLAEGFIGEELEVSTGKDGRGNDSSAYLQSLKRCSDNVEMCRMLSTWGTLSE